MLDSTPYEGYTLHCFRRMGAAAMAALGAAMLTIAVWGRWTSELEVRSYATPPLAWHFALSDDAPWPDGWGGVCFRPIHAYEFQPMGALSVEVRPPFAAPIPHVGPGHDDPPEAASVRQPSEGDIIILGSLDDDAPPQPG